jgi:hypothetical protein
MSKNVSFEIVDPPVYAPYSASDDMVTTQKVLWKGDWALSIAVDKTGFVGRNGCGFYVYSHWPLLGKSVVGTCKSLEEAHSLAKRRLSEFECFLRRIWFLPRTELTKPSAEG